MMNTKHALGFLAVGVFMKILPGLEPAWFRHLGPDGTSATATWVVCMGLVQTAIGGSYLFKHQLWPSLRKIAAYRPAPRGELALQEVRVD